MEWIKLLHEKGDRDKDSIRTYGMEVPEGVLVRVRHDWNEMRTPSTMTTTLVRNCRIEGKELVKVHEPPNVYQEMAYLMGKMDEVKSDVLEWMVAMRIPKVVMAVDPSIDEPAVVTVIPMPTKVCPECGSYDLGISRNRPDHSFQDVYWCKSCKDANGDPLPIHPITQGEYLKKNDQSADIVVEDPIP